MRFRGYDHRAHPAMVVYKHTNSLFILFLCVVPFLYINMCVVVHSQ